MSTAAWVERHLGRPRNGERGSSPSAAASPERLAATIGAFLARVHTTAVDPEGAAPCRIAASDVIARADQRCRNGLVDVATFDDPYRGSTPSRLLAAAVALEPPQVAGSVVLGARSLDQFRFESGQVVGWVVGPYGGWGDPASDVAWTAQRLASDVGPAFVVAFIEAYGDPSPSPLNIEFWATLGQLL